MSGGERRFYAIGDVEILKILYAAEFPRELPVAACRGDTFAGLKLEHGSMLETAVMLQETVQCPSR